ncbi:MAG: P1 family peptidase, partial [Calditrichota bacterium]
FASFFPAVANDVTVAALAVVNALGDVIDPATGIITAGARNPETKQFVDSYQHICSHGFAAVSAAGNTTLAVVATDAAFTKEEVTKIAMMAQNGIGRSTRPAHTMYDGDMVFSVSCGTKKADINVVGAVAAEMVAKAIVRAVRLANGL